MQTKIEIPRGVKLPPGAYVAKILSFSGSEDRGFVLNCKLTTKGEK